MRPRRFVALAVAVIAVSLVVIVVARGQPERGPFVLGFPENFGKRIALKDAQRKLAVLKLPKTALKDPCTGETKPLTLLQVRVEPHDFVLLAYSHGIWLRHMPGGFELANAKVMRERLPGPSNLTVTSIRRHVAHVHPASGVVAGPPKDTSKLVCQYSRSASAGPGEQAPRFYWNGLEVSWEEKGVHFELYGPFQFQALRDIASRARFAK